MGGKLLAGRDFNEWRFALQAPWGRFGVMLAFTVAAVIVLLAILATRDERTPWRRVLLVALRAGAVAAALVLFLQPAIQLENVTRLPNRVAVLVDASASMGLQEEPGAGTRAERAARFIDKGAPAFAEWRKLHNVDFYTFGNSASAGGADLVSATEERLGHEAEAKGDGTHIREALAGVRGRYEGRDLGGVVVVSDGIDNGRFADAMTGKDLAAEARDFLRSLDAPVHTVWTGRAGLRDVAIARVLADDFAFARNAVKVEAVVRVLGGSAWSGKRIPVTLKRDGAVVRTVELTVDPAKPEQKISFEFTPDRVGKYLYEISTPVLDGDAIPENNSRIFLIKVIRDKIRVLLVAGRPSWDERFLRGLLKHNPNVDLISFFILRTPTDVELVSPDEMSLIPFPTEELFLQQLRSFDLVFLQNFNYAPYGIGAYLGEIKDYVIEGGGLAMLGGDLSFTSGGYSGSPVADVLPVELLGPAPEDRLISLDSFKPRLTAEGRGHPITALRLDARDNSARWDALPALDGANLVSRARAGATVLAAHPTLKGDDGKPLPVLAVQEVGKGRSLAFTSDSSWRWGFGRPAAADAPGKAPASAGGDDGRGRDYQKFWESAIRWLVRDPELRLLRLESDQGEYRRGERVRLRVRAFDPEYRPAQGLEVQVTISHVGGGDAAKLPPLHRAVTTDESGEAMVDLDPLPPGGYRAVARAHAPNGGGGGAAAARTVAPSDDEGFVVRGAARELEDPEARPQLLSAIAEATGASYLGEAADVSSGKLTDLAFQLPQITRINKHRDVELWSTWITLAAAAVFLSLEWTLRRRRGLL